MHIAKIACIASVLASAALVLGGCNNPTPAPAPNTAASHEHAHEHHHHGPHNGHIMEVGKEEYHAEWTHDESGKLTMYILDAAAKKDVPIAAEQITIDVKIGDNPPKSYELVAVNPMEGKAAAFAIVDKQFAALFDQLKSSGVELTLHVNIDGKQFDQVIKEHHHDH